METLLAQDWEACAIDVCRCYDSIASVDDDESYLFFFIYIFDWTYGLQKAKDFHFVFRIKTDFFPTLFKLSCFWLLYFKLTCQKHLIYII